MKDLKKVVSVCAVSLLVLHVILFLSPYTLNVTVSLTPRRQPTAEAAPAKKTKAPQPADPIEQQLDSAIKTFPDLKTPRGLLKEIFYLSRRLKELEESFNKTDEIVLSLIRTNAMNEHDRPSRGTQGLHQLEQRVSAVEGRLFSIEAALRRR